MKYLLICLFFLTVSDSNAQLVSGDLLDEGREIKNTLSYVLEGKNNGWAKYELSVDRTGKVTGAKLIETNLKSTPSKMQIRNHVMKAKFEAGTHYPKFHHVVVKVTLVKSL